MLKSRAVKKHLLAVGQDGHHPGGVDLRDAGNRLDLVSQRLGHGRGVAHGEVGDHRPQQIVGRQRFVVPIVNVVGDAQHGVARSQPRRHGHEQHADGQRPCGRSRGRPAVRRFPADNPPGGPAAPPPARPPAPWRRASAAPPRSSEKITVPMATHIGAPPRPRSKSPSRCRRPSATSR